MSEDAEQLMESLGGDQASLEEDDIESIRSVARQLGSFVEPRHPQYLRGLPDQLVRLAEHEQADHPHSVALRALLARRPSFLLFGEDERTLASTYELADVAHGPPSALANLAALAHLDLVDLHAAANSGEWGRVESLQRRANEQLERLFHESWHQAAITVRLRVDESILRILVETTQGQYDSIAERSDGLRWFIALLAYTETHAEKIPPILLVDEAESHLHYDAQADLVRVFARQRSAAKVIYTTHSAGCLPEDLGSAIRVVAPVPDTERSTVRNWFWEESPGFSPLFLGMGASALAFTSMRRAVIAEGATELILLPSVLRDATGRSELGFQVAPGLAEVSPSAVEELGLVAARVAYVVDGDAGGRAVRRKLIRQGVPDDLIVQIGDGRHPLSLEDLLGADAYVTAVNEELRRSHGPGMQMPGAALPDAGRSAAVARWCQTQGIQPPSKRAVANRVLERDPMTPLLGRDRRVVARRLYDQLVRLLGLEALTD